MNRFVNISLRLPEDGIYQWRTPEFSPRWLALNGELAKRNLPEARYGENWDYDETRHSPETAADDVVATAA